MKIPKPQFDFYPLLEKYQIPFVVIGGHAVQFHGYVRNTEDVDLIWLRNPDSELKLLAALQEANACWMSNERDPRTGLEKLVPVSLPYIQSTHLMMVFSDYGFVDLFDYVPGLPAVDVRDLYNQSILSGQIRYVSLDWLKKMKRAANRLKDQLDLDKLQ